MRTQGRFLWPEHLQDRVATNLLYYRANYAIVTGAIVGLAALTQTRLQLLVGGSLALFYAAAEWDGRVPADWNMPPLRIEQRLSAALLATTLLVHWLDAAALVTRLSIVCGGLVLGHASFRARSLSSRWAFFKETVDKQD